MIKTKGVMFLTLVFIMLLVFSCAGPESERPLLTAELPLHLEEHRELAKHFTRPEQANLTAEQLRTLRSLGYIK